MPYRHLRITEADFMKWQQSRKRWAILMETSEMLLLVSIALWGAQLLLVRPQYGTEPISHSLQAVLPSVPLPFHGVLLILCASLHLIFMATDIAGWRRHCIVAEMLFFLYVEWSLLLSHLFVPGVFIIPAFIAACALNWLSLLKPHVEG